MRRVLSISLLVISLWAMIVPLLAHDADSDLPPCCRRDGKHHCAMMDAYLRMKASGAPTFSAPPMRCPMYPQPGSRAQLRGPVNVGIIATARFVMSAAISHESATAQPFALRQGDFARAHGKRGPPISSLA